MKNEGLQLKRPLSRAQAELADKLMAQVTDSSCRAVSFKLENILVITPFSLKSDLFILMEDDFDGLSVEKKTFTELRTAAEDAAVKKCGAKKSLTLDLIYDIFQKLSKVSTGYRDMLMKRECELIEHFSIPRLCGKNLFLAAKEHQKKVIVISESFYPRNVIVNILDNCGLSSYDELVITTELGIPASDRTSYFDAALKKSGAPAGKLLHIGSDVSYDVETPILKGAKAVLMQPVIPLMVKSGRLRGFIENEHLYDSDSPALLKLRCALGVYAAYAFDTPQNKSPQSDLCGDDYMLGAAVLGILRLCKQELKLSDISYSLKEALTENKSSSAGAEDFIALYDSIFNELLDKYGSEGCQLPLKFLEKHAAAADRDALRKYLPPQFFAMWVESITEPDLAPVYASGRKKNALEKLADRLFPPNTKVRNIAEDILNRGKSRF